jgi:hypothetical protein
MLKVKKEMGEIRTPQEVDVLFAENWDCVDE